VLFFVLGTGLIHVLSRFLTVLYMRDEFMIASLVKCLECLPNLHTLEIVLADRLITAPLKNAFKRVKLPQIKTLILPPAAYPLLEHCHNVEDVVCVTKGKTLPSEEFFGSLVSNQDSKVKQLAVPLFWFGDLSRQ
jgi:hypothetical protein